MIAVSIGAGSTVQALVCAAALDRWIGVPKIFESGPATLIFTGIAAAACLIASTWGAGTLNVAGVVSSANFLDSWQTWWLGDLIGMVVFAPVFLTWRQSMQIGTKPWRLGEVVVSFTLLAVSTAVVFAAPSPAGRGESTHLAPAAALPRVDRVPFPAERRLASASYPRSRSRLPRTAPAPLAVKGRANRCCRSRLSSA